MVARAVADALQRPPQRNKGGIAGRVPVACNTCCVCRSGVKGRCSDAAMQRCSDFSLVGLEGLMSQTKGLEWDGLNSTASLAQRFVNVVVVESSFQGGRAMHGTEAW
ncbi:hypothetical protein IF2G_04120 [Cordyceps javanica]|nr:hypothetical protein IF2G_04120 [Cordyceps javanica]